MDFFLVYVDMLLFGGSLTYIKNTVGFETCTDDLLSE